MKLKMLSLAISAALLFSCGSTRTSTSENAAFAVPSTVNGTFQTQYPTATQVTWSAYDAAGVPIDWELTGWPALTSNDYVVTYNLGPDRYYSWYNATGQWIGTAYTLATTNMLPAAINNTLTTQFANYTIDKVQKEIWKDQQAYELQLVNGDQRIKVVMDMNGNILKQKQKS
jgi:hypothetical protein